jgi:hypothetical protein
MTFDQFVELSPDQLVWFEIRGGSIKLVPRKEYDGDPLADNEREAYNKQGRSWFSKPTEEEMLSEAWEDYNTL